MKKLLLLLALAIPAFAGDCPVNIVKAEKYIPHIIKIKYENTSGKEISAIKFGVVFFDGTGDPHADHVGLSDDRKTKSGKQRTGSWDDFLHQDYDRLDAFPVSIAYTDGTFWHDDGSHSCNAGVPGLVAKK